MKFYLSLLFCIMFAHTTHAQDIKNEKGSLLLGLNYGQAKQDVYPFVANYLYRNEYFKIQINYLLSKKKMSYELLLEPSIYLSEFKGLLRTNKIIKKTNLKEYALNIGIITRCELFNNFSTYALISGAGPMLGNNDTNRLSKGFAFSNIFGLGFSYKYNLFVLDIRTTLRHNSNLDRTTNNRGHNSVGIESGISYKLR